MKRYAYLEETLVNHITNELALDLARFHKGDTLELKIGFRNFNLEITEDDMGNAYVEDRCTYPPLHEFIEVGEID